MRVVDWWELREGEYVPLPLEANEVFRSRVFPGLFLNVSALLRGDLAGVLAALQEGIKIDEHDAFVARLGGKES